MQPLTAAVNIGNGWSFLLVVHDVSVQIMSICKLDVYIDKMMKMYSTDLFFLVRISESRVLNV